MADHPTIPNCVKAYVPLTEYFKEHRAFHGFMQRQGESTSSISKERRVRHDGKSDKFVEYEESTIKVGPTSLKFQRTLRVPDNAKKYLLPPVNIPCALVLHCS